MIDFNVDFLTKQFKNQIKSKALKGYHDSNVQNMVGLANMITRRVNKQNIAIAFIRISVSRRLKVQKLLCIERPIMRWLQRGWISIKRSTIIRSDRKTIKKQDRLIYPLSILNRIVRNNIVNKLQIGWVRLLKNKKESHLVQMKLNHLAQVCYQYQKRLFLRILFTVQHNTTIQSSEYIKHTPNLYNIFSRVQAKHLRNAFCTIVLRVQAKFLSQLQKSKVSKRDETVKSVAKRNQAVNELKRKNNNLKGQVNEQNQRNNKRRADGLKENGIKLMKKNEELRGYQIQMTQLLNDYQRMERQVERKTNFISSRPKNRITLDQIRSIYTEISLQNEAVSRVELQSKIDKQEASQFASSPNYIKSENAKLKYLINLYEKLQGGRKSDYYISLDNENACLKGLISSFMRMKYFQPKRQQMLDAVEEINTSMEGYKRQMGQLKKEIQVKKK